MRSLDYPERVELCLERVLHFLNVIFHGGVHYELNTIHDQCMWVVTKIRQKISKTFEWTNPFNLIAHGLLDHKQCSKETNWPDTQAEFLPSSLLWHNLSLYTGPKSLKAYFLVLDVQYIQPGCAAWPTDFACQTHVWQNWLSRLQQSVTHPGRRAPWPGEEK